MGLIDNSKGFLMARSIGAYAAVAGILAVSLYFGLGRLFIIGHVLTFPGSFEALSHIWAGFLLACSIPELHWLYKRWRGNAPSPAPVTRGLASVAVVAITGIETYMFVHQGFFAATFG